MNPMSVCHNIYTDANAEIFFYKICMFSMAGGMCHLSVFFIM